MIKGLMNAAGENLPTSSFGRIGRTALAVMKGGRMIWVEKKNLKRGKDTDADVEALMKMISSVGRLKGVAMKMGQIMSYIDMAMPQELREALSVLQTHAQPMSFDKVRQAVMEELKSKAPQLLENMSEEPVSAASIGQVHKATLPDGTIVAVKVQYPKIAKAIEADFGPAAIGTKMATLFYPKARFDDFIKEAKERFLEECDYLHEAHCQNQFAEIYANHPVLFIPAVHETYCASKVLTTTFVDGMEFDAFLETNPSQKERDKIGRALFEFYLGSLFKHQIYNCDPHPGNYLFLKDGRIAMLDHGCTRQFDTKFVTKLANLTTAIHSDERARIHLALSDLKIIQNDQSYDYDLIRGFLRSFYGPMLEDNDSEVNMGAAMEMREVIKSKRQLASFSLPGEFLFLFRIRFGLMSVLAKLGSRSNWYQLEKEYVDEFIKTI